MENNTSHENTSFRKSIKLDLVSHKKLVLLAKKNRRTIAAQLAHLIDKAV